MGKATSLEERIKMFEMSQQNHTDREIAVQLNISIKRDLSTRQAQTQPRTRMPLD